MRSRHRVDTSVRFDRKAELPPSRQIGAETVPREPYLASEEVEDAVNLALALGRPLLLQGDPGAGKTRLAHAVAYALGRPLELAVIKSTSQGRDLLYTYDNVRRLYDSQRRTGEDDPAAYVTLGPLGRAIARAQDGQASVVLIDEIDKADLDFPNDLLYELEELAFTVTEVAGMRYGVPPDRPDLRPLVVVTNNEEKTLPDAFLRRCIFHYVEFPADEKHLGDIIAAHGIGQPALAGAAIQVLLQLRALDLAKKPGLSELLDWISYLAETGVAESSVAAVPHAGALVKQHGDQARVDRWLNNG